MLRENKERKRTKIKKKKTYTHIHTGIPENQMLMILCSAAKCLVGPGSEGNS